MDSGANTSEFPADWELASSGEEVLLAAAFSVSLLSLCVYVSLCQDAAIIL